jgi:hypothetical protein
MKSLVIPLSVTVITLAALMPVIVVVVHRIAQLQVLL